MLILGMGYRIRSSDLIGARAVQEAGDYGSVVAED